MQSKSNEQLLHLLRDDHGALPSGVWLDLGCGAGDLLAAVRDEGRLAGAGHVGVDLSPAMIRMARERHGAIARFEVADAADLPLDDASFDVVASNSALHWLNVPEEGCTPQPAFAEITRVLRGGGVAVFSISGAGTARRFRVAYAEVYEQHPEWREPAGTFRADPIGSMPLADVVDQATVAGLHVVDAVTRYEPVIYDRPGQYADDVAAYGLGSYTAAFASAHSEAAWASIVAAFEALVGDGPYVHDQYMSYVLARPKDPLEGGQTGAE